LLSYILSHKLDRDVAELNGLIDQSYRRILRRGNIGIVIVSTNTEIDAAGFILDSCATIPDAGVKTIWSDGSFVICASDTNRRERRLNAVGVFVHISYAAGNGAEAALNQIHGGSIRLSGCRLKCVLGDGEGGVSFQCNNG
jgi:hypothetical protein